MPASLLRHDPSGIAPESFLGLDAPGAGRLDAKGQTRSDEACGAGTLIAAATRCVVQMN